MSFEYLGVDIKSNTGDPISVEIDAVNVPGGVDSNIISLNGNTISEISGVQNINISDINTGGLQTNDLKIDINSQSLSNLNTIANAGTNLNTSLLALESGNILAINTNTNNLNNTIGEYITPTVYALRTVMSEAGSGAGKGYEFNSGDLSANVPRFCLATNDINISAINTNTKDKYRIELRDNNIIDYEFRRYTSYMNSLATNFRPVAQDMSNTKYVRYDENNIQWYLSSSSISDTMNITLVVLLANFTQQTFDVTLNGQNEVMIPTLFMHLLSGTLALNSGSQGANGDIYLYNQSGVTLGIPNFKQSIAGTMRLGFGYMTTNYFQLQASQACYLQELKISHDSTSNLFVRINKSNFTDGTITPLCSFKIPNGLGTQIYDLRFIEKLINNDNWVIYASVNDSASSANPNLEIDMSCIIK